MRLGTRRRGSYRYFLQEKSGSTIPLCVHRIVRPSLDGCPSAQLRQAGYAFAGKSPLAMFSLPRSAPGGDAARGRGFFVCLSYHSRLARKNKAKAFARSDGQLGEQQHGAEDQQRRAARRGMNARDHDGAVARENGYGLWEEVEQQQGHQQ